MTSEVRSDLGCAGCSAEFSTMPLLMWEFGQIRSTFTHGDNGNFALANMTPIEREFLAAHLRHVLAELEAVTAHDRC